MTEKENTWKMDVHLHDFPKDTLLKIKQLTDKNGGQREWLANVYVNPKGEYVLGSQVEGTYSGVSMKPDEQTKKDMFYTGMTTCIKEGGNKDSCKNAVQQEIRGKGGLFFGTTKPRRSYTASPEDLVATIHMHPIRSFETKGNAKIRSQFSGTDIGSEFAKAVRDGKTYRMFLAYPHRVGSEGGMFFASLGGKQHTRIKMIVFPGKQSMDVMKASNPNLTDEQIWSITTEGKNIELVDWYAYQDECKKRGLIEELDIEDHTGTESYASYSNYYAIAVVAGVIATLGVVWYINRKRKMKA